MRQHFEVPNSDFPRAIAIIGPDDAAKTYCMLYSDSRGRMWIGTDAGLNRYEPATDDFVKYDLHPADNPGRDIRVRFVGGDRDGMVWIGTYDSGLIRLDPETDRVTTFRHDARAPASLSNASS